MCSIAHGVVFYGRKDRVFLGVNFHTHFLVFAICRITGMDRVEGKTNLEGVLCSTSKPNTMYKILTPSKLWALISIAMLVVSFWGAINCFQIAYTNFSLLKKSESSHLRGINSTHFAPRRLGIRLMDKRGRQVIPYKLF